MVSRLFYIYISQELVSALLSVSPHSHNVPLAHPGIYFTIIQINTEAEGG